MSSPLAFTKASACEGDQTFPCEDVPCPFCGSAAARPWRASPDRMLRPFGQVYQAVRCSECGTRYTRPRPTMESLAAHYPEDYSPYRREGKAARRFSFADPDSLKPLDRAFMVHELGYESWVREGDPGPRRARFPGLTMIAAPPPPASLGTGRLLEIGCSHGLYLHRVRALGWAVQGIELDEKTARIAREERQLDVRTGPFAPGLFPPASFDCIAMWQVLEHLPDPMQALRESHRLLRPGGVIMIGVPNTNGLIARIAGNYYYPLDMPRHFTHFTTHSVRRFLQAAGFVVRDVYHQTTGRDLLRSLAYWAHRRVSPDWAEALRRMEKRRFMRRFDRGLGFILVLMGKGARLTAIAEKPHGAKV